MPFKQVTFTEKDLKKLFRLDTPMSKAWRTAKRVLRTVIWFLTIFGVFFYAINGPAFWQRTSYATQGVPPADNLIITPPPPVPVTYPSEILIAKIGLQAPALYDVKYADLITRLRDGVVRYEGSADPGQVGNVVILGHSSDFPWSTGSYKTVFALLDKLAVGDEIILPYPTNKFVYSVSETKVVKANDLTVLGRTSDSTLTLITCYPVGTSLKRLVIIAKLKSGPIGTVQSTEPFLGDKIVTAR